MEDLASGIRDGMNIGVSFAKMMDDEETKELQRKNLERELQLREKTDPLDIQSKELDIERTQGLIKNDQVVLDTNISKRDIQLAYGEESMKLDIAGKRATNKVNEERASYWSAQTEGIISDNMKANLGSDSTLFNEIVTKLQQPNLTSYELGSIGLLIDGIESPILKAQLKNLNPQYAAAWKSILPVLQSGNFEEIPSNFNEGLTTVMKPLLDTAYLGSTFITAEEGEGKVEAISFDGNFIAKGRGDQMILGANVTVNINGEQKKYQTFLPDRNDDGSLTFREELEPDDSKAVSVADIVDYASSNAPLAALIYKNPQVMKNISSITNMIEETYVPENKIAQQQIMSFQKEAYRAEFAQYNFLIASVGLGDAFAADGGLEDDSAQMQKAAIIFKSKYGDNSGIILEDGIYKSEDPNKTLLEAIFNNAPSLSKIRKMWDGSPLNETVERFNDNPDNNQPGKAAVINIDGFNFGFDTTKEEINNALRDKYKNNNELINAINFASENFDIAVANGDADPEDYAVSLKNYLNDFYKNAGK